MSFIRKIRKNGKIYLAEVENRWINGKCVQKHIRYIGKEADGRTILSTSISEAVVDEVKIYGPLLVLNHLAQMIGLQQMLGDYGREILSMVYAHCMDYKSVNRMERWYARTDLAMLLGLEKVTEERLLEALDSLENMDSLRLQQQIFPRVISVFKIVVSGIIYDVTNTYLYGKRCPLGKLGNDKEGVKGRLLIQVGLAVTKDSGIPVCHKVLDGNVHDARMFGDFVTDLRSFRIEKGTLIYDRGIASGRNIKDARNIGWETLCGLPIKGNLENFVRSRISDSALVNIENRVRLGKSVFYVIDYPYSINGVKGVLALIFNENQKRELRESLYDEIEAARVLLSQKRAIKEGLKEFFTSDGKLRSEVLKASEELLGYTCLFSSTKEISKNEMVHLYFDKDIIEKAFRSLKGIVRLRPVRHWLYNRVTAHVFICYLSYLLLSLLQNRLKRIGVTAEEALIELESLYKVYLRDPKKNLQLSRTVALTKKQESIMKTVDRKLMKT
jgi:transposase